MSSVPKTLTGTNKFGIYNESVDPLYPVGHTMEFEDGRVFVYCKNAGTALTPGKLISASDPVANHKNITVAATIAADATNQVTLDIGATAVAANEYDEGWLYINDATGEGTCLKIRSHGTSSGGSEEVTFTLYDKFPVALTVDVSQATLVRNLYHSVVLAPTTKETTVVGVPLIDVTASYYFWAQCKGPAPVLASGAVTKGVAVIASDDVAGAVEDHNSTEILFQVVGSSVDAITDTEYGLINLKL